MNKARVKVKKRKVSIKKILILILVVIIICLLIIYICSLKISNIYIVNNNILSDKEVIDISNLSDYPSFVLTNTKKIERLLKKNIYVSKVKVSKKFWGKIYITINEYSPLCIKMDTKELVLSSGNIVDNEKNIQNLPYLVGDITNIYDKFINKFNLIDRVILEHISIIEYSPNDVDKERFLLYMDDGNNVYITLSKIEKINKYESIFAELDGVKGIIYLDSGDYVEVKK